MVLTKKHILPAMLLIAIIAIALINTRPVFISSPRSQTVEVVNAEPIQRHLGTTFFAFGDGCHLSSGRSYLIEEQENAVLLRHIVTQYDLWSSRECPDGTEYLMVKDEFLRRLDWTQGGRERYNSQQAELARERGREVMQARASQIESS